MIFNRVTSNILKGLINLFYPPQCAACNKPIDSQDSIALCKECLNKIKRNDPPFCTRCGKHLYISIEPPVCSYCKEGRIYFDRAYSIFLYEGLIKELIHKLKYNKKLSIAKTLSNLAIDFINYNLNMTEVDYIIPVPLHRKRSLEREFNQSYLIAKDISTTFEKPILKNKLIRLKPTTSQTALSRNARFENLRGAFVAKDKKIFLDRCILLVDDVFTTGATINEASRVLKECNAKEVIAITIARGL